MFAHMLLKPSFCRRLDILLAEVASELASSALIVNPALRNIWLARHDEGNNDVMTNMRLILLRANSLRHDSIRAREKTRRERARLVRMPSGQRLMS